MSIFKRRSLLGLWALVLIVFAMLLMYFDQQTNDLNRVRASLAMLITPLEYAVNLPVSALDWLSGGLTSRHTLLQQNKKLQTQLLLLQAKMQSLLLLEKENRDLRALLQSSKHVANKAVVAQIIATATDPFVHQITLNKGRKAGVYVGQPVIDASGIIGQVIHVSMFTARVLLLSAPRSAVPVIDNRSGIRAITIGTGTGDQLQLLHVAKTSDIKVGDELVTSGLGGRYPEDYPVAVVNKVQMLPGQAFAMITATPTAHLNEGRMLLLIWPTPKLEHKKRIG